jgi:hypothetical protein
MKAVPENLLEISEYTGEGYRPLIDYGEWRVAILRYIDELLPENISRMQRHVETDEVFVLLSKRCLLFLGDGAESIGEIHAQDMLPLRLYNIKRGTWHTHTLSEEATVLIVENGNTAAANSPEIRLSVAQRQKLGELTRSRWRDQS